MGFVRLHILYHAAREPVFGLNLMEELARHGYRLSPGTLYPILHQMERNGFLSSEKAVVNGKMRFVDLKIDKALLADGQTDAAMLEDLIKAALAGAQKQAAEAAAAAMSELAGGMNIPGIDGFL